jgi:hypothetical protein
MNKKITRLTTGGNRSGNYDPREFIDAYEQAETNEERAAIRNKLKRLDSGRLYDAMSELHTWIVRFDLEQKRANAHYISSIMPWVRAYAVVEDQNPMIDYQP